MEIFPSNLVLNEFFSFLSKSSLGSKLIRKRIFVWQKWNFFRKAYLSASVRRFNQKAYECCCTWRGCVVCSKVTLIWKWSIQEWEWSCENLLRIVCCWQTELCWRVKNQQKSYTHHKTKGNNYTLQSISLPIVEKEVKTKQKNKRFELQ